MEGIAVLVGLDRRGLARHRSGRVPRGEGGHGRTRSKRGRRKGEGVGVIITIIEVVGVEVLKVNGSVGGMAWRTYAREGMKSGVRSQWII